MVTKEKQKEMTAAIEEVLNLHNVQIDAMVKQAAGEEGDFSGILAQCEERLAEMKANAEEMLKKSGMTQEQLEAYVSNRANFSREEWEILENTKKTCEEIKLQDSKILQEHIPKEILEAAKQSDSLKKTKKKRKKMIPKKNWIQM